MSKDPVSKTKDVRAAVEAELSLIRVSTPRVSQS
jgi:hypothetical protein